MNPTEVVQLQAHLASISAKHRIIERELSNIRAEYASFRKACESTPQSPTAEIDSIPGRRLFYDLVGGQTFDATFAGQRAQPINFLVSQDGPFVMTHYPLVLWKPSAPNNATRFGQWRPVASWPLPDQVVDDDRIDLSWEFVSGGSQRNFQNLPRGPMFSRPDNMVPLPIPTLFSPNETIQLILTYESVVFSAADVPTTQGTISASLSGYRIVNM